MGGGSTTPPTLSGRSEIWKIRVDDGKATQITTDGTAPAKLPTDEVRLLRRRASPERPRAWRAKLAQIPVDGGPASVAPLWCAARCLGRYRHRHRLRIWWSWSASVHRGGLMPTVPQPERSWYMAPTSLDRETDLPPACWLVYRDGPVGLRAQPHDDWPRCMGAEFVADEVEGVH